MPENAIIPPMRTPDGKECRYFYGDYHRGREKEECRLLEDGTQQHSWSSNLCVSCPIPGILQANACEHMELKGIIYRPFFIFKKRVRVTAFCHKSNQDVAEPHVGCGQCHSLPSIFTEL